MATRYLPVLAGTPYAGLIVDRCDKPRVLMLTNGTLGLTSLAIGSAVLTHSIKLWQIFTGAAVFGMMTCLDNPARMAFVPELVGSELIRPAVTTNSIMANIGRTLGPAVAAAVVHYYGLGWCFVFNTASFAFVIVAVLALNTAALQPTVVVDRSSGQLRDGLAVARRPAVDDGLRRHPDRRVRDQSADLRRADPARRWHRIQLADNGTRCGSGHRRPRPDARPLTGLARLVSVAAAYGAAMALPTISPTLTAGVAAAILAGAASIAFLTTGNSAIQLAAPPRMRGRVTGLWTTAFIGSTPIGGTGRRSRRMRRRRRCRPSTPSPRQCAG